MTRALRIVALVGLATLGVGHASGTVPTAAAAEAVTGSVSIAVQGRADLLGVAQIGVRNSLDVDVAPTYCTSAVQQGGAWLSVTCAGLPEGAYRVTLDAPDGLDFQYGCAPVNPAGVVDDPSVFTVGVEQLWNCSASLWTADGSGPVTAAITAELVSPPDVLAAATLQFVDQDDVDHFAGVCAQSGLAVACHPTDAGTYHFAATGLPGGAISEYACQASGGPQLPSPTEIVVTGATGTVTCRWVIATPTLEIRVYDRETSGVVAGVAVWISGPGGEVGCTPVYPMTWLCSDLQPGTYDVHTNLAALPNITDTQSFCFLEPVRGSTMEPPVAVGTTRSNTYVRCAIDYLWRDGSGSTTTTVVASGGPTSSVASGSASTSALPTTGVAPAWPVGAVLVAMGAALSVAARRRQRRL